MIISGVVIADLKFACLSELCFPLRFEFASVQTTSVLSVCL